MGATRSLADLHEPILVELDEATWGTYLDRAEQWLHNVLMFQAAFHTMAGDVRDKVREPEFKELLGDVAETAGRHERRAVELYRILGRDPSSLRRPLGAATAKAREAWADLIGVAGGAAAPWRDLLQLHGSSLDAMNAFAVAEQIGYSLGLPELASACFEVVSEKYPHHLLLQELSLEMVPWAILYRVPI